MYVSWAGAMRRHDGQKIQLSREGDISRERVMRKSHGREGAMGALMLGGGKSIPQVAPAVFAFP